MSVKINYRMIDSTNRVVRCGKRKMIAMEWIPWQEGTIKDTRHQKNQFSSNVLYTEQMCFLSWITGLTQTCLHLKTSHIDFDKMKRFVINKIFFHQCSSFISSFTFLSLLEFGQPRGLAALPLVAIGHLPAWPLLLCF